MPRGVTRVIRGVRIGMGETKVRVRNSKGMTRVRNDKGVSDNESEEHSRHSARELTCQRRPSAATEEPDQNEGIL